MRFLDYDSVDPLQVLHLTMLALDLPFTPERGEHIRRTDPRPFPFLTVNAVEDDLVLGQVGVFRLPMVSTEGREDVGGLWALSTHPACPGRDVASVLLEEAHARMRETGLRFSALLSNRYSAAYELYQERGYKDMQINASALARWETAHQPTRLRAARPGPQGYEFVEEIFEDLATAYIGFAWRHTPFARLRSVGLSDICIIWENTTPVGYALVHANQTMLTISNLTLKFGTDTAEAIAAVTAELKSTYVEAKVSRPVEIASLCRAGYQVAHSSRDAFMIKPLVPAVTVEDARRLFGIGTDRFLISWLDLI